MNPNRNIKDKLLIKHPRELETLKENGDIQDYSLYDNDCGETLEITFPSGKTLVAHNWDAEYNSYLDFTQTSPKEDERPFGMYFLLR